jgi:hypothetical protein
MCARYTLTLEQARLVIAGMVHIFAFAPRYNIGPARRVPVILDTAKGVKAVEMRWGMRRQKRLHFISPDRPAVKARTTPALRFLQENKSMDLTSRKGFGFSIAVRQKSNGRFPSSVKDPPTQATLELVPVGCAFFMLPGVLKSRVSMP